MSIVEKLFGNFPDGWIIARLSSYLKNEKNSIKAGPFGSHLTNTDMQGSDIKVYNQRTVLDNDFINGDYYISEEKFEELKGFIVEPNDMLVTTRGTIGKCVIVPENVEVGILHPCLIKMKISEQKINPNYLQYIFNNTNIVKEQVQFLSNSTTIDVIYTQTLKDINFTLPVNIVDQNKIVSYLDKKVTEIDLLISKKELKVNLLQQQRQSIITEAVTKGLNPNVKMKDSGVEWIGDIPEHWKLVKIKHLIVSKKGAVKTGPFGSQLTNNDMNGNDVKIYNQRTVLDNDFVKGEYYISNEKYEELKSFEVCPGDILITTRGTIGKVTIVPNNIERGILHPCLIRMQLCSNLIEFKLIEIIFNETNFIKKQIELLSNATTIEVIYSETLKNLLIVLPPEKEQQELLIYIENILKNYNEIICNQKKQIEKLKEYRQSLIYEAVTGKIDVRDMELD